MPQPDKNTPVTQAQINSAINIDQFPGAKPDSNKAWHRGGDGGGLFEGWSTGYGYADGFPLYGGTLVDGAKVHIYYLPQKDQFILLRAGEVPGKYKQSEGKKKAAGES